MGDSMRQHEKIIRGLVVGVGFIYYGRREEADETLPCQEGL
jgi:26S proteasome regulatory subunit N2